MCEQSLNTDTENQVENPDEDADDDDAGDNDERIVYSLLAGGPDDLAALALQFAEPLTNTCKETGLLNLGFFSHEATSFLLLRLAVERMLPAETAVLVHFQTIRIILLVFVCVIVSLLALGAGERNFNAHK